MVSGPLSFISSGLYELTLDQAFKDYLARIMPADKLAGLTADEKVLVEMNAGQDYVKKYLADVYDFLVFLPSEKAIKDNFPFYKANYLGQILGLGGATVDDTEGIGMQLLTAEQLVRLDPFEKLINQEFGSFFCGLFENGTQQGAAMVDVISTLHEYPNNNKAVDYVLLQELAHRWGLYLSSNGSQTSNPLGILGRDNAHWNMFFDGGLSPMDALNWVDNGNGTFTLTHIQGMKVDDIVDYAYGWRSDIPVNYAFNDFDLYAMGVLDKSNVASSFVIDNPTMKDGRALTEDNFLSVAFGDANFISTFTIKGTKRQVTIQNVIQIEGERDPAFSSSQKNFSVALIYMKDDSDGSTGNSAKSAQTRWKDTLDDIWATATRSLSAMSLGFTSAAFNVFKENVLGLFDESVAGEGQDAGEETKAQGHLSTLDALDALIQYNETLLVPLLERAQTNPLLDAYLGDLPEDLAEIKQDAIDYRKAIQDALALVGDSSAFIAGKRSELETKVLQAAITGLLPAGFGSSAEAIIQEVLNLFTGVKDANDSFTAGSASFQLTLDTYKIKLEGLSQPFEGTMTLAGGAEYADTAVVALELHNLPVSGSSLDPVADQAYALDQSLGLYFTGKDYYNCAKLQEKWLRSTVTTGAGNGWYYIAPGGKLYKWLGGARDHNEYVTTLSDAYYQTPGLLYEAQRPAGAGTGIVTASYTVNGVAQGSVPGFMTGDAEQTVSLTLPAGDGLKEVDVTLTNGIGDEFVLTKTVTLDATKPLADFTINGGAAETDVLDIELDLSKLSDATSGIDQVRVSMDGGTSWIVVDLATLTDGKYKGTLPDGKGKKTIKVEVTDKVGNKNTAEQTIKYQPPSGPFLGTMTLAGDAEYTGTAAVSLELNNLGDEIVSASYAVNGSEQGNIPGFAAGVAGQTLSLILPTGDGLKEVAVTLTNGSGDEYVLTKMITLDQTKPVIVFTINGGAAETDVLDVELDLSKLSDATSGMAQVRVSMDGGTSWIVVDLATLTDGKYKGTLPDGKGTKAVKVEVTDKVGNKDTAEQTIKYVPPKGAFPGTMTLAGGAEYTDTTVVALELNDLPVSEGGADPVAEEAYELDQSLGLYFTGKDYYNCAKLQEKWMRAANVTGAGNGWYYIAPGGVLYRWLGGARTNNHYVTTLSDAYYQTPGLLYDAEKPVGSGGEGIVTASYAVNGAEQGNVPGFKTGEAGQTLSLTLPAGDGLKEVEVTLTDGLGDEYVLTKTITLDETKPLADFTINGGAAETDVLDVELDLSK
ncbi:MAG: Ig-like domain repeat protein, partial [Candidatus Omnitrophica bacterium]|nr:Ig-like domain repeat protein [Candidatus Omnitrophota bacterium]